MKKVPIKATSGSKEKGTLKEVPGEAIQYDNLGEALKALKEDVVLALVNRQIKTDALNALRKPAGDPTARLVAKALKDPNVNPEAKASLQALLKKYNIAV